MVCVSHALNWPSHAWLMSAGRWASSDLALELGDRVRWSLMWENHGYDGGRVDHIARRFPLPPPPPYRRIVDVPVQLELLVPA